MEPGQTCPIPFFSKPQAYLSTKVNFMRIILPVIFGLFAICGVFGVVLLNASKNGGSSSSGDGTFAWVMQYLGEELIAGAVPEEPVGVLVNYLPAAPIGWTREGYVTAHGEEVTEATYQPSKVVISGTNSLLARFDRTRTDVNGAAVTYRSGDEMIAIAITARSDRDMRSLQGSIMTAISGNMSAAAGFGSTSSDRNLFATLDGVPFRMSGGSSKVLATGVEVPTNYRVLTASMGGQLNITIVTNSSDAAIADVMRGIDILGLNTALTIPDLTVTPGTGLITTQIGELAMTPPPPTLTYKAFNRLRSGVDGLKEEDVRLLQNMANGKIKGWPDLYEIYGLNPRLSDPVREILGEEPELAPLLEVKFTAAAMLQSVGRWNRFEVDMLEGLSRERYTTRAAAERRLEKGRIYSPPVLRLIALLPEQEEEVVVAGSNEESVPLQELIIRRGVEVQQGESATGDCTIELGVRRCIVDTGDE